MTIMMRDLKFFTAVKIQVGFYWVVTLCSVVVGYQRFIMPPLYPK
jgi:hypothetical protein